MTEVIAGRYEVHSSVGAGGMGEVFLATDTLLGRLVAIKRIRRSAPGPNADDTALKRLRREAQAAAAIHHPNVVTVYDLINDDEVIYIVMEYVEGPTLADLIRDHVSLDPLTVAVIGAQVAAALEAAHRVGVTHRDVKPANILLVQASGTSKLADFGIARSAADTSLTGTGLLIGSISFMAPEIANGGRATAASDVYSLGATLFAATEGYAPFASRGSEASPAQIVARLLREPAPPARSAGPLAALIGRMLAADPADRPTAAEAARLLRRFGESQPLSYLWPIHSAEGSNDATRTDRPGSASPSVRPVPPMSHPAGDSPRPAKSTGEIPTLVASTHESPEVEVTDSQFTRGLPDTEGTQQPDGLHIVAIPETLADRAAESPAPRVSGGGHTSPAPTDWSRQGIGEPSTVPRKPAQRPSNAAPSRKPRGALVVGAALLAVVALIGGWRALPGLMPTSPTPLQSASSPATSPQVQPAAAHSQSAGRSTAWWRSPKIETSLEAGPGSWSAAIDTARPHLYVADAENRFVQDFDTSTQELVATVHVPEQKSPYAVAVDPASRTVFLAHTFSNSISMVDATTHKLLSTIKVSGLPGVIAVDSARGRAYVGCQETEGVNGHITVVDVDSRSAIETLPVSSTIGAMEVDPDTHLIHAVGEAYWTIDPDSGEILSEVPIGPNFSGFALNPSTRRAYLGNGGEGSISVVDITKHAVIDTIELDDNVKGLAIDPASGVAFVWSYKRLYVIDLESAELLPNSLGLSASQEVNALAVPAGGDKVYAIADGQVIIISG